jgi:L,D-transpeptidase YbiS
MSDLLVEILIAEQRAQVLQDGRRVCDFVCSTSKFGTGFEPGSYQTPTGRFHLHEKIGEGALPGTLFKSRLPTGQIWTPNLITEEDLILTRILWLAGDDPENAQTLSRYIYLHGTNQEHLLGTPSSHGCIRLSNTDIITLFDLVKVGTKVTIH